MLTLNQLFTAHFGKTWDLEKPRYKGMKGKHRTERCNEDDKYDNSLHFLRASCVPGTMRLPLPSTPPNDKF